MNPVEKYCKRYIDIKNEKRIESKDSVLLDLILNNPSGLNNYFMAALGMSTVILRLGAVIQLCKKLEKLDDKGDIIFLKQIVDNLREILPSDTEWKTIWSMSAEDEDWMIPIKKNNNKEPLLNRFITYRNKYVHQIIRLEPDFIENLMESILIFDEIYELRKLFDKGSLEIIDKKYHWIQNKKISSLYPYIQVGIDENEPYIFQGLYDQKTKAHLLNLIIGKKSKQDASMHLEPIFKPINELVNLGAGQYFDHSNRISYYQSCFFGRKSEKEAIIDFCNSDSTDTDNFLQIKSPAGHGKGALISSVIEDLINKKNQVLYHFCGSGIQNSLQAILYHLIIQGNKMQYWENKDLSIKRKLDRLPSKNIDLIHFFQDLLTHHFKVQKNNPSQNLVIIIDALDEAFVAFPQLTLSDWFYKFNEKEEPEEEWISPSNIRWIFSYRCESDGSEKFYKLPFTKNLYKMDSVQPLKGLNEDEIKNAFNSLSVSEEFLLEVVKKSVI